MFPVADDASLGKQVRNFRFIFTSHEARGKNKPKIPKSQRISTPGKRKSLRSKTYHNYIRKTASDVRERDRGAIVSDGQQAIIERIFYK